jgi:hypothetical protein
MAASSMALQDAARELNIGIKTLKRWLDIAGIEPAEDPRDRRRRLIRGDDLDQLKELYGYAASVNAAESDLETRVASLQRQLSTLEATVASLSSWLAAVSENVTTLAQRAVESREGRDADTTRAGRRAPARA